ncbi:hypothetical protein Droror1_Dr00023220 [Drosera rotundifolia]
MNLSNSTTPLEIAKLHNPNQIRPHPTSVNLSRCRTQPETTGFDHRRPFPTSSDLPHTCPSHAWPSPTFLVFAGDTPITGDSIHAALCSPHSMAFGPSKKRDRVKLVSGSFGQRTHGSDPDCLTRDEHLYPLDRPRTVLRTERGGDSGIFSGTGRIRGVSSQKKARIGLGAVMGVSPPLICPEPQTRFDPRSPIPAPLGLNG